MTEERRSKIDIHYEWIPATLNGAPFELPGNITELVSKLPQRSAIYRWMFLKGKVALKVYIGETESLQKRIRGYLKPGPTQETNKRINTEFALATNTGLIVRLELLHIEPVYLNKVLVCNENLCDPFVRRMMENFVLADSDPVNCEILNLALNPIERRKQRAMKRAPLQIAPVDSKEKKNNATQK